MVIVPRLLLDAGISKRSSLRAGGRWKIADMLSQHTGIKSIYLLETLLVDIVNALPGFFRDALGIVSTENQAGAELVFPSFSLSTAEENQGDDIGAPEYFQTPELPDLSKASKKVS